MNVKKTFTDDSYFLVSKEIFKDLNLSLKDWGLLVYIISLDSGEIISAKGMARKFKHDKIDSIRTAIKNLETAGYLERTSSEWKIKMPFIQDTEKIYMPSRFLKNFLFDEDARLQNWTNKELASMESAFEKLLKEYDEKIVYTAFKYSIQHLPKTGVNDRVAYVVKSIQSGCKMIYWNSLSDEERKEIKPGYKSLLELFDDFNI